MSVGGWERRNLSDIWIWEGWGDKYEEGRKGRKTCWRLHFIIYLSCILKSEVAGSMQVYFFHLSFIIIALIHGFVFVISVVHTSYIHNKLKISPIKIT